MLSTHSSRTIMTDDRLHRRAKTVRVRLWVSDENRKCTFLSQSWSEFTGRTEGGDCEPGWSNTVHPDDREQCRRFYEHLLFLADGECDSIDHRVVRPDGATRWVRLHIRPVYTGPSDQRKVSHLIGTIIDITKQREFEQSLQDARARAILNNDSKGEFLAYMSHEIRTPMTAILGYAELLREHINNEEAIAHLNTIRHNGDYLLGIINDILDLSKIEAGKLELHQRRFDILQLVEDIRSIMGVRAKEKGLQLEVLYEGRIPSLIDSDPKRLKQILINLVGNAIKFTKQGGVKLVIDYKSDDPQCARDAFGGGDDQPCVRLVESGVLRFRVIDVGIGMSDEHRTKLFKPFEQGNVSISREFGGTGLGLAISQRLAEMLGGNIEVESELGKGSTFAFAIATGDIPEATMIDPGSVNDSQSAKLAATEIDSLIYYNILMVDDGRDIRFLCNRILIEAGANVEECEDGQIAVDYVRTALTQNSAPDLILLDMQMPNLDGYQTAIALRSLGFTGPIIALTADAMHGDMSKCIQAGCNSFLSKPIIAKQLIEAVAKSIREFNTAVSEAAVSPDIKAFKRGGS